MPPLDPLLPPPRDPFGSMLPSGTTGGGGVEVTGARRSTSEGRFIVVIIIIPSEVLFFFFLFTQGRKEKDCSFPVYLSYS